MKLKSLRACMPASVLVASILVASAPAASAAPYSLDNDSSKLTTSETLQAQPGDFFKRRPIHDLAIHDGQIYAGYGDYGANTGPISIQSMDLETGEWTSHVESDTEEVNLFREIDGELYAPNIDPRSPWSADVGYATNAGGAWHNVKATPFIHVFDMATSDGKDLWMAGSAAGSDGISQGATLKRSVDGDSTWTTELVLSSDGDTSFDRFYWVASANGKIYTQFSLPGKNQGVRVWDDGEWSTLPIHVPQTGRAGKLVGVLGDQVIVASMGSSSVATIDSITDTVVQSDFAPGYFNDLFIGQRHAYLLDAFGGVWRSSDGKEWEQFVQVSSTPQSLAVHEGKIYLGRDDGFIEILDIDGDRSSVTGISPQATIPHSIPFNPRSNVTVTSPQGLILNDWLTLSGNVDTNTPGDYQLTYQLTDDTAPTQQVTSTVTVAPEAYDAQDLVAETWAEVRGAARTHWYGG